MLKRYIVYRQSHLVRERRCKNHVNKIWALIIFSRRIQVKFQVQVNEFLFRGSHSRIGLVMYHFKLIISIYDILC